MRVLEELSVYRAALLDGVNEVTDEEVTRARSSADDRSRPVQFVHNTAAAAVTDAVAGAIAGAAVSAASASAAREGLSTSIIDLKDAMGKLQMEVHSVNARVLGLERNAERQATVPALAPQQSEGDWERYQLSTSLNVTKETAGMYHTSSCVPPLMCAAVIFCVPACLCSSARCIHRL